MDLMQIRGFHLIDSESRMPAVGEHGKYIKWDNDLGVFVYVTLQDDGDDIHITNAVKDGDNLVITRSDGQTWTVSLLDGFELQLPGDTKILFDEQNTIGGRSNLRYDYTNKRIILTDDQGIWGKITGIDDYDKTIFQYTGAGNIFIDYGSLRTPTVNMAHNIAIGNTALYNVSAGEYNVAIGFAAGGAAAASISNSVFIGANAGRLEQESDRLYIGVYNYDTLQEFRDNSLIYGDFSIGRLFINDRLHVSEEVHIGHWDESNVPEAGMIRFVTNDLATTERPQYFDGEVWRDFCCDGDGEPVVTVDHYVSAVTVTPVPSGNNINNVVTIYQQELTPITFTIVDRSVRAVGLTGDVQITDGNGNFDYDSAFNFNKTTNVLRLDGAMHFVSHPLSDFTVIEGLTISTGNHIYTYLNGEFRQLDNEPYDGENSYSTGENLGLGLTWYKEFDIDTKKLRFNTFVTVDDRITLNQNTVDNTIEVGMDFDVDIYNAGTTGKGLFKAKVVTATSIEFTFRQLHSSDGSVAINYGPDDNYIDLTVVAAVGGGEANTASNVGTGYGWFYRKNVYDLEFKTIIAGTNVTITEDTLTLTINATDSDTLYAAENVGSAVEIYKATDLRVGVNYFQFKTLVAGTGIVLTPGTDTIQIDATGLDGGEANRGENVGTGTHEWYKGMNGVNLQFRTFDEITSGDAYNPFGRITFDITDPDTILIGTTAELNTASNVGGYAEVYQTKTNENFAFRTIKAGSGAVVTQFADYIQIDATGVGGGEVNTASNVGTGYGWYKEKVGVDLRFKTILAGTNIHITNDTNELTISATDVGEIATMENVGDGTGLVYARKDGTIFKVRSIRAGNAATVVLDGDTIVIDAKTGTVGEANYLRNDGTGAQIGLPKEGVALPIRTLTAVQNITVAENGTEIDFTVPDFVVAASNIVVVGSVQLFDSYIGTNQKTLVFRPIIGTNGVSAIVNADNAIEISIDPTVQIPAFTTDDTPEWASLPRSLSWNIWYNPDSLNPEGEYDNYPIVTINLGLNLTYDPVTNTLDAIGGGSGDPLSHVENVSIVRDPVTGFVDRAQSSKNVQFDKQSGLNPVIWDAMNSNLTGLGWLAFEDTYWPASKSVYGIVRAGDNIDITADGTISVTFPSNISDPQDSVLYGTAHYLLHDEDNTGLEERTEVLRGSVSELKTVRRARARANIGAAYVNGDYLEPFKANSLDVDDGGVLIDTNIITTDLNSIHVAKDNTEVSISHGEIDITIDGRGLPGDVGVANFYMYNTAGTKVKVAKIQGRYELRGGVQELVADLKIKGNIMFRCTDAEMNA